MRIVCPWLAEGPAAPRMRSRAARGRPNWWVVLAVSLALMALLVATAAAVRHDRGEVGPGSRAPAPSGRRRPAPTTTCARPRRCVARRRPPPRAPPRTTARPRDGVQASRALGPPRCRVAANARPRRPAPPRPRHDDDAPRPRRRPPSPAVPADRTQTQGYLQPAAPDVQPASGSPGRAPWRSR